MNHEGHESHEAIPQEVERAGQVVVDAALKVHKALGPGLLESAYEHCLAYELNARGAVGWGSLMNFNVPLFKQGLKRVVL